jgi:hypothetical protein
MTIEEGMLLYFIPPCFASGKQNLEHKKRLMLVINKNYYDNTITLINISKVDGKPNCFTYPFNVLIRNFNPPLPRLSFAKINDNYIIENFADINKFLYKNGQKINNIEFNYIIKRYNQYIKNNKIELISFTKDEFLKINNY